MRYIDNLMRASEIQVNNSHARLLKYVCAVLRVQTEHVMRASGRKENTGHAWFIHFRIFTCTMLRVCTYYVMLADITVHVDTVCM